MGNQVKTWWVNKYHLLTWWKDSLVRKRLSTLRSSGCFREMYLISDLVYTWGNIYFKGSPLTKQAKPTVQPGQNIKSISCGNNHVTAVDNYGDLFVLGSNEYGQLGLEGELHAKTFKKLNNVWLGPVRKTFCIADTTFMVTRDEETFFCGKISHHKDSIEKPRQGEFSGDIGYVTSIAGTIGKFYLTTATG